MRSTTLRCRYCERRHEPRYLCDPARKVLDALYARGMSFNMPSIEFPEPIPAAQLGLGLSPEDVLVNQLVVQAATVPVADVVRPAIVLTGRSVYGAVLPKWLYAGTDEDMARLTVLVRDMADLAVRAAATVRATDE